MALEIPFGRLAARADWPYEGSVEEVVGDDDEEVLWTLVELERPEEEGLVSYCDDPSCGHANPEEYWVFFCEDCLWQHSRFHIQVSRNHRPVVSQTLSGVCEAAVKAAYEAACARA